MKKLLLASAAAIMFASPAFAIDPIPGVPSNTAHQAFTQIRNTAISLKGQVDALEAKIDATHGVPPALEAKADTLQAQADAMLNGIINHH
jgi:opacity protein-like surface antigen